MTSFSDYKGKRTEGSSEVIPGQVEPCGGVRETRDPAEHQTFVDAKRRLRMATIDALPGGLRALVHSYGFTVVKSFMDIGVREPRHIKHLVETVLNEFSPTRGSFSTQGVRTALNQVEGA